MLYLKSKTAILNVYNDVKYYADETTFDKALKITYKDCVVGFEVITEAKAVEEIESLTDNKSVDDFHEYLVLYFEDGTTSTFRNSYCDLFII